MFFADLSHGRLNDKRRASTIIAEVYVSSIVYVIVSVIGELWFRRKNKGDRSCFPRKDPVVALGPVASCHGEVYEQLLLSIVRIGDILPLDAVRPWIVAGIESATRSEHERKRDSRKSRLTSRPNEQRFVLRILNVQHCE